jgi:hypothetical protein
MFKELALTYISTALKVGFLAGCRHHQQAQYETTNLVKTNGARLPSS